MNLQNSLLILLLIVSLSLKSNGQELPNFTGNWNLNLDKSNLEARWTNGITGGTFDILHEEPTFSLERVFYMHNKKKKHKYELITDGQRQKGKFNTTWSLIWQQDTLVLTVTRKKMLNTVKYYFTNKGELIANENQTSSKLNYHNRWVFDKQDSLKTEHNR